MIIIITIIVIMTVIMIIRLLFVFITEPETTLRTSDLCPCPDKKNSQPKL